MYAENGFSVRGNMDVLNVAITLGQNIASLRAQRALGRGNDELSKVLERLSSGARINRASDDAAGLALASTLNANARIFGQGARNINDGIGAFTVFEGALDELSSILERQKELATQASNGTFSSAQRIAMNAEASALTNEYNRIISTTNYNNVLSLANGGRINIQAGTSTLTLDLPTLSALATSSTTTTGTGTFGTAVSFATGGSTTYSTADSVGDLNGDGFLDLVMPDPDGVDGHAIVMLGNGDGTFGAAQSFIVGTDAASTMIGDFNNDGKQDIAVMSSNDHNINILIGNGNGTFLAAISTAAPTGGFVIRTGDLNGDGNLDIVVPDAAGAGGTGAVVVYLGNGDGRFKAPVSYSGGTGYLNDAMTLVDVNNDGRLDAVTVSTSNNAIGILLGNANGSFSSRVTYAAAGSPTNVTFGDLNGDGNIDIITADYNQNALSVFLGNGNGSFSARTSYAASAQNYYVSAADLNGDGRADLLSIDRTTNRVSVFINNGNGTFRARVSYQVEGTNTSVLAGDFNNDGVNDIFVFGNAGATASLLLGNGTTTTTSTEFNLLTQSSALAAITTIDSYLSAVSVERGKIGAAQSRLNTALSIAHVAEENHRAAAGRIMDADVADDVAKLLRIQIVQKAQAAILAQANLQGELVLELLG